MKWITMKFGQILLTLAMVGSAIVIGQQLWFFYMETPWTRDARIRADVIRLAPDVSGSVEEVFVTDNEQITEGMPLFRIEPTRFQIALREAASAVKSTSAAANLAGDDFKRYQMLISKEAASLKQSQQAESAMHQAQARYQSALAAYARAQLDLERTTVIAPASGKLTNFTLRRGNYVTAGSPIGVLVEKEAIYVVGYFEETKLRRLHINDRVKIDIMGEPFSITGHVASIAAGIEDHERSDTAGSLASVAPTFSWVRLAQRIPVRIEIDNNPENIRLIAGRTATVSVEEFDK
ncbi:HlyD family secretion protein [Brucella pseudogrignonensis]|nr:HlyD family secretion protein [Brucella pseudogrignonensis]